MTKAIVEVEEEDEVPELPTTEKDQRHYLIMYFERERESIIYLI